MVRNYWGSGWGDNQIYRQSDSDLEFADKKFAADGATDDITYSGLDWKRYQPATLEKNLLQTEISPIPKFLYLDCTHTLSGHRSLPVNDGPALEAIYEGNTPATGAPCIL